MFSQFKRNLYYENKLENYSMYKKINHSDQFSIQELSQIYKTIKTANPKTKWLDVLRKQTRKDTIDAHNSFVKISKTRKKLNKTNQQLKQDDLDLDLEQEEMKMMSADIKKKNMRKRKQTVFNVHFAIYTQTGSSGLKTDREMNKGNKTIKKDGIVYVKVGKMYVLRSTNKTFTKDFNYAGGMQNFVVESDKRWSRIKDDIVKYLNSIGATHLESYMDAIYVHKVEKSISNKPSILNIFNEVKHNCINSSGIYNPYMYYEINPQYAEKELVNIVSDSDYLKDNYKTNSCFLTVIIDTYYNEFQKLKNGFRVYKEDLTYDYLCELLGLEKTYDNIGCTIEQASIFFKKYDLGLVVYDVYMNIIYEYHPMNRNKDIHPATLYIITYNAHVFKLNSDINSISKKYCKLGSTPNEIQVSENYSIINDNLLDNKEYHVLEDLDEIIDTIQNLNDTDDDVTNIQIEYCSDMNKLVHDLMLKHSYTPSVRMDGSLVKRISLNVSVGKKKISVTINDIDKGTCIDNDVDYDTIKKDASTFNDMFANVYKWLINKKHISYYNDKVIEFEKYTPMLPVTGTLLDKIDAKMYNALDINKAYTSNLIDMKSFPVFNEFDVWKEYDGHTVEDYTQYYVKSTFDDTESAILFGSRCSRCYGYKLNRIDDSLFKIIAYKRPSNLIKTNACSHIEKLYDSKLDKCHKKLIVNILLGLMEKKIQTKTKTKLFTNLEEARYYRDEYGGEIQSFSFLEEVFDDTKSKIFANPQSSFTLESKNVYMLTQSAEKELTNGFLPIKEMIYDIQRLKLYNMLKTCSDNNIKAVSIKTDAILVDASENKLRKTFELSNDIGGLKIENDKRVAGDMIHIVNNSNMFSIANEIETLTINDEYDKNELGALNTSHNNILYLASDAGCGKSTASSCGFENHEILFVSPFNKQCIELKNDGYDAVTVCKFFSKGINNENIDMGNYTIDEKIKLIVFDEILLNNLNMLQYIYKFIKHNTDKYTIIANGDVNQLAPINFGANNVANEIDYRMDCVRQMFDNIVMLKEIKRLKTEHDKERMQSIKRDIFDNVPVKVICKRYGIKTITKYSDLKTTNNIAYFNFRCNSVNRIVHKKQNQPKDTSIVNGINIYKGLVVQCKKHYQKKGIKTFVNNLYKIEQIGKFITVIDINDEMNKLCIDRNEFFKVFTLSYCNTCHSLQGCSIDEDITIFDANTPYVNRYWLYTAITRVRNLSNVTIFIHDDSEVEMLQECKLKQYLNNKIDGYIQQDKQAGREINKRNYLDYNYMIESLNDNPCCYHCQCNLYIAVNDDKDIESNLSYDRIDDSMCHTKDNCVLSCVHCNCKKIKYV